MTHRTLFHRILFALACTAAFAATGTASASDGRLQISQTCVSMGCFPGDTGGFPVTITQPGSYQLTSSLSVSSADTTAIKVNAGPVTIDLNGFAIRGVVTCDDNGLCSGQSSSTSVGIGINNRSGGRLIVHNGQITGMGGDGIRGASGPDEPLLAHDLMVAENGRSGIVADEGIIRNVVVERNGAYGIVTGFGSLRVIDSYLKDNNYYGLASGGYCSGIVSTGNDNGTVCTALGPNVCETPTNCD